MCIVSRKRWCEETNNAAAGIVRAERCRVLYQATFGPIIANFGEFENGCCSWIWAGDIAGVVVGGAEYWRCLDKFGCEGFPGR